VNNNLTRSKDISYWEWNVISPWIISLIILGIFPNIVLVTVWQNIDFITLSYI
jgi:NADH:ubiquinone oxidoreductase subunit 4 (subunit M)